MCVTGVGVGEPEPARGSAPALTLSSQDAAVLNLQGKKENIRSSFGFGKFGFSHVLVSWRSGKWGHALGYFSMKIHFSMARKD